MLLASNERQNFSNGMAARSSSGLRQNEVELKYKGCAIRGDEGDSWLVDVRFIAHRSQAFLQKSQLGNQVALTPGFKLRGATHTDLLANTAYRSYQFDFIDREAEILQYTVRRQRVDMDIYLAHGIPQLKTEEDL